MSKICLCLSGKTLDDDLRMIEKYRAVIDLAELRVDMLDPNERFHIRRFPEMAGGVPVILTIRRKSDGGHFESAESARITLIAEALANAKPDKRMNFAYVDLEEDLEVPALEEAARAFGTVIIRSFHDLKRTGPDIARRAKALSHAGDEIVKCACAARSLDDVTLMLKAARELKSPNKLMIPMGPFGSCLRILAQKAGSLWTYAYAKDLRGAAPVAPGQLDAETLHTLYRFHDIRDDTAVYGILGYPLTATGSPLFFNTLFTRENINAVYVPFPSESAAMFFNLAAALDLRGASVTVPHKQNVLPFLSRKSADVENLGACNTLVKTPDGWSGFNTDTTGFSESILAFMKRKDFKGVKATVVGAGGAARAVAYQIWRLRGKALVINRSPEKAERLAGMYGFRSGGLDDGARSLIKKYSRLIVNTTSAGMAPDYEADPLKPYKFRGNEVVMDLIYAPEQTAFLRRAADAGCATLNGFDMLTRQAKAQYRLFFNAEYPEA